MAALTGNMALALRSDSGALASRRSSVLSGQVGRLSLSAPRTHPAAAGRTSLSVSAGRIGPGKKWEKLPLTSNGKPEKVKIHVKCGDTVIVTAGKDKGKVSEVTKVYSKTGAILVKDCNIKTVHKKPVQDGETGTIITEEAPMHHSNVMHYSKAQKVRSRVGRKMTDDGKKVRYLIKTGEVLEN